MGDKSTIDSIDLPGPMNSETNNSTQSNAEVKKSEGIEVIVTQENLKPEGELVSVEEPEKLQFEDKKTSEVEKVNDAAQLEETAIVDESAEQNPSVGPVSDQLISSADNSMESTAPSQEGPIQPTRDQIVPVGRENLIEGGSQQQVIPVTESDPNSVAKLEDSGVDLDQQSVLSMKDSELKDLVMRELSEFLTEEPPQNVGTSFINVKSEYMKSEEQKKIENLENSMSENKIDQKDTKKSENDIADALSTLATAALNQAPPASGSVDTVIAKPTQPVHVKQEGPAWCDVGVIKGTTCIVKQFYSTSITDEHENTSLDHLPDYTNKIKIDIQPGTAYKLRIAAINTCGRGEWSEISAFKTCLPGYPGAPSAIKITKAPDGASLTWEAPPTSSGKILEYSVCLAIKNPKEGTPQSPKPTATNLNFVRVYCGPHNAAVVSHESLGAALIDRTNKPAIIFRIAAKNEKGYGPATQVRWLQDSNVPGSNKNSSVKREKNVNLLTGVPKRPKV
ncbi:Fibronectin type III,Immunoglobulin-like fold [Cinara cedri]|uniref:Fibronectin type III,Immunoglobulin-like fold n=1 Tax=Cinara cedri TaxID=506608 RepID=A0A5E4NF49_9HEMI|nr:Fibronectin type III,Immunoglobulin-like fold [Cinara cedri]